MRVTIERKWIGLAVILPLLAGCAAASTPAPSAPPPPEPSPAAVAPEIPQADAGLDSVQVIGSIAPVRISVPQLSIDMDIEPEELDEDGAMGLPKNAATAGWYSFGPGLKDPEGAVMVAAHIDSSHDGIGPFSKLKDAAVGSPISVTGSDGSVVDYVVTEVKSIGKIEAPVAEMFDRSGAPRLTLVTCGGEFNSGTGHYLNNIIVTATPVAAAGG